MSLPFKHALFGLLLATIALCDREPYENKLTNGLASQQYSIIQGQIVGGKVAEMGQFPWQVMVLMDLEFQCGGTLVDAQWVLTSAHCVDDDGDFSVILGALSKDDVENNRIKMDIPSENIFVHEDWDPSTIANDIALIQLPVAVSLPQRKSNAKYFVNAVRLPKGNYPYSGHLAVTSGWGRVNPRIELNSDVLQWVTVEIITNNKCAMSYGSLIRDSHICTDTKNTQGACNGDTGGPLVIQGRDMKFTLIGIASYVEGNNNCLDRPGLFTRVAYYSDWIKETMKM